VVLALDHRSPSFVAARRAVQVADALGAHVEVQLACSEKLSGRRAVNVAHIADFVEALRPRHGFNLKVHDGVLIDAARPLVEMWRRPLVIVAGPEIGAEAATSLVEELATPVLVARDSRSGEVLAATDMRSSGFPVLSVARSYAKALGRKISYLHNAKPVPVLMSDPMAGSATYTAMLKLQDDVAAAKTARLRAFAKDPESSYLSRSGNAVDAILDLARFHDADLVVVGHRAQPWWLRFLRTGVARSIVEQSQRSVLVTPLLVHRS
jgi:nucleotide-binding universal stress UspA family protein